MHLLGLPNSIISRTFLNGDKQALRPAGLDLSCLEMRSNILHILFSSKSIRPYFVVLILLWSAFVVACASALERRQESLHAAVIAGDLQGVKNNVAEIQASDAKPMEIMNAKNNALKWAAWKDKKEIVAYLIASGADYLTGPYEDAVLANNFEMATILLKAGGGRHLLLQVMANDNLSEEERIKLMKFLIETAKNDVNAHGYHSDKRTAVWYSVKRLSENIRWKGIPSKIDEPTSLLIKAGADLNISSPEIGGSLICFVLDQPQIASELVKAGAVNKCADEQRFREYLGREQEKFNKEARKKEEREKEDADRRQAERMKSYGCTYAPSGQANKVIETCGFSK